MSNLNQTLRDEVENLGEAVHRLEFALQHLSLRVCELEHSRGGVPHSFTDPSPSPAPSRAASSATAEAPLARVDKTDHEARVKLAKQLGTWLRKGVDRENRGASGRELLDLQSRIYIVLCDFNGELLSHPKVFKNFASVTNVCKRGNSFGDSNFIGVPSEWEARIVVSEAGYTWPGLAQQ